MKMCHFIAGLLCCSMLTGIPRPAEAEPISAAIGLTALLGGGAIAGAVGGAIVTGAISIGAQFILQAFTGKPKAQATPGATPTGTQVNVQYGAAIPRSRIFGYQATAGKFEYWNLSGDNNAYLDLAYSVGDGPHDSLAGLIANGKICTFGTPDSVGTPVPEFNAEDGTPRLWVKFFQGFEDQAADARLVATANPAGRWTSDDTFAGIAWVRVTMLYDEKVFQSGKPDLLFIVKGALLYDPRKDSTNGGFGSHRWTDQHTWEWSDNVSVAQYNHQRGLYLNGELVLGEGLAPVDLITDMYVTAANACDELVTKKDGTAERRYRIAMNVGADQQHRVAIQNFLDAMAGQLVEQVGAFGPVAGVAQTAVLPEITDADLIVGKPVTFSKKRSRADLLNAVFGSYTEPDQQYGTIPFPPRTSSTDEAADGERLAKEIDFPQVQSGTQAQRLAEIARRMSRYQATATITVRFRWAVAEAGDWVPWNSARRGNITWRVESYKINEDETVTLNLREIGAEIFTYNAATDELDPQVPGDLPGIGDLASTVSGFTLAPTQIFGANGVVIPALRCLWSPVTDRSIVQVIVQYRLKTDDDSGLIKQAPPFVRPDAGEDLITDGIQADTVYQARATIITVPRRITVWTDWVDQLAPPLHVVPVSNETLLAKFNALSAELRAQVTTVLDDKFAEQDKKIAQNAMMVAAARAGGARHSREIKSDIVSEGKRVSASIEQIETVATDAQAAVAELQSTVGAQFDEVAAQVSENTSAIATFDGYAAGNWSVVVKVDGAGRKSVAGIALFTDSDDESSFTVNANNFFVAFPDAAGGDPVPVWTIANVNGVAKAALRGDMLVDGTILTRMIAAGQIKSVTIDSDSIETRHLTVNSVDINALIKGAATQRTVQPYSSGTFVPSEGTRVGSQTVTILSGAATCTLSGSFVSTDGSSNPKEGTVKLYVDGSMVQSFRWFGDASATWEWTMAGLSAGSHTIHWTCRGEDGDVSGSTLPAGAGQTVVVDLRR